MRVFWSEMRANSQRAFAITVLFRRGVLLVWMDGDNICSIWDRLVRRNRGQIGGVCFFLPRIIRFWIHNSFFVFLNFNHFRSRSVTLNFSKTLQRIEKTPPRRCSAWSGLASSGAPLERFGALLVAHHASETRVARAVVKGGRGRGSRGLANRRRREKESSPRIHT